MAYVVEYRSVLQPRPQGILPLHGVPVAGGEKNQPFTFIK